MLLGLAPVLASDEPAKDPKSDLSRFEVVIDAPASFVYPYVVEGDRIANWSHDDRLEISFPRGTQAAVGMQIHFAIRLPTRPGWTVEIRRLIPDREMDTAITDGIFRGSLDFLVEPLGEGRARLVHVAKVQPEGAFIQFAWEVAGRRIHHKKMEELMLRIKKLVESDWIAQGSTAKRREGGSEP